MRPTTRRTLDSSKRHPSRVTRDLRRRQLPTVPSHAVPTGECQSDPPSLPRAIRCSKTRASRSTRAGPLDVLLHVRASFVMKGPAPLTTNAVCVRRQAERGADGRRAVDRLGRAVGAGRAAVAGEGAALPLSGPEATAGPGGAAGDLVRVAHRDLVDAPAGRAWLWLRGDLLAP